MSSSAGFSADGTVRSFTGGSVTTVGGAVMTGTVVG